MKYDITKTDIKLVTMQHDSNRQTVTAGFKVKFDDQSCASPVSLEVRVEGRTVQRKSFIPGLGIPGGCEWRYVPPEGLVTYELVLLRNQDYPALEIARYELAVEDYICAYGEV